MMNFAAVGKWLMQRSKIYSKNCTLEYEKSDCYKEVAIVEN